MNVLFLHLDGKLPSLPGMRIAAHYRALGDTVEVRRIAVSVVEDKALRKALANLEPRFGDPAWDKIYGTAIFETTQPLVQRARQIYPAAVIGGTGVSITSNLSEIGIETEGPLDYSDYPSWSQSIGFTQRGCRLACEFCVVPRKEGKAYEVGSIERIWRGGDAPRHVILLDNDFFGVPGWKARIRELLDGGYRVCFCQGINARMLNKETAEAIASVNYRDTDMDRKRIYTAWDSRKDERTLFRGLEALANAGVLPDHIMVYCLIGYWPGETHADRDYRRKALRDFGARPYPMPYRDATTTKVVWDELKLFQKWCVQRHDLHMSWEQFLALKGELRKLGSGRHSLPLFPEPSDDDDGEATNE